MLKMLLSVQIKCDAAKKVMDKHLQCFMASDDLDLGCPLSACSPTTGRVVNPYGCSGLILTGSGPCVTVI